MPPAPAQTATPTSDPNAGFTHVAGAFAPGNDGAGNPIATPASATTPTPTTGTQPPKANTSSTTLSNANIIENTIPALNARAASLTTDPPTTLTTTTPTTTPTTVSGPSTDPSQTDYQTLYNNALAAQGDITQDPTYQSDMQLINSLQDQNDSTTSAYVNSIMQNYQGLTETLQQQQAASDAKTANALLLGGSSRYAPVSSGGILDMQTRGDMQALANLQDQENQKIAEVQQAQNTQDYNLMSKKMSELDTLTANKQKLAQTIATNMQKANQTAQAAQVQNQQDNAIAELVQGGTTDPNAILQALTKAGYTTATLKDVTTTLEGITKATGIKSPTALSGAVGQFYTLQAAGELPDTITSLPQDQQLFAYLKTEANATKADSTKSTSSKSAASTKTYTDGGLTYTGADLAADTAYLKSKEGSDGYVDPAVYQNAYNTWIKKGGTASGFLKAYPPKDFVNPANDTLPAYLRSSTKSSGSSSSSSDSDPFGLAGDDATNLG